MPVKRFRDVSEMEGNTWYEPGDPRLFAAIRAVWDLAARTMRPRFPPGVYKHRSIEEANELREEWDRANFEAFRARRRQERE
ncbi:MAG TPA: hypothetical protein VLF66_09660 [Thermoanaerobaculia bacterium]|nr:hypothetical protein [Thermoanaerobaculia bacterium]